MHEMFKKLLERKSKLSLAIDLTIVLLAIFIMIPQTRKGTIALVLKPTLFAYQPTLLNKPVPLFNASAEWKLRTLQGDTCTLADFDGKPTIIHYWATWCAPCLAEMGQFERLYSDYSDKVNFVFVTNEKRSDVAKFVKRKKIDLPIYQPMTKAPEQLSVNSLPVTIVIDAQGNILMRKGGMAQWNGAKMRNILNQLISKNDSRNEYDAE